MPELPEVETICLQLNTVLPGLIIKDIQIFSAKSFIGDKKHVISEEITGVRRFAKILVLDLFHGSFLAVHLKMTGQLIFSTEFNNLPNKYTRIVIEFANGDKLFFNDLRKFGWIKIVSKIQLTKMIQKYGPEPLKDLTLSILKETIKSSNKPIKLLIMDQEKIAGVGNIYANESLFIAKINPTVKANKFTSSQMDKLFHCLEKVLQNGIKWGGASSNNYVNAYGQKGKMQEHFLIYGKDGQLCPNKCGEKIIRIKLGGRGTFYCSHCQPN